MRWKIAVSRFCAILPALLLLAPASRAAGEVMFAPHRAVYDISLVRAGPGSTVTGVQGRMVYELGGSACDGYTQNMRFVTRMTNQDGADTLTDLRNSSWEDAAATTLRFSASQYQNDILAETSQGDAVHGDQAGKVKVELAKPAKKRFSLSKNVYFPIQHASALIAAARRGETLLAADLYDGSENGEKYYKTSSLIGKKYERGGAASVAALKDSEKLVALESWPVSISYFEPGKDRQDLAPSYELSFRFFENGVSTDLMIDYGEFAIKGKLKELTLFEAGKCLAAPR